MTVIVRGGGRYSLVVRELELFFGKEGGFGSCSEERGIYFFIFTVSCGRKKSFRRSF